MHSKSLTVLCFLVCVVSPLTSCLSQFQNTDTKVDCEGLKLNNQKLQQILKDVPQNTTHFVFDFKTLESFTLPMIKDLNTNFPYLRKISTGKGGICSCKALYFLSLLHGKVKPSFNCTLQTSRIQIGNSDDSGDDEYEPISSFRDLLNECEITATPEWSTWSDPTGYMNNRKNGFNRSTRTCLTMLSNRVCEGFATRSTAFRHFSYANTAQVSGRVTVENIQRDGNLLSTFELRDMAINTSNALHQVVNDSIRHLFTQNRININRIDSLNLTDVTNAKAVFNYVITVFGPPFPNITNTNPVKQDQTFTLESNGIEFAFNIISSNSTVTEVNPCTQNNHMCDKNAFCWKSQQDISYACQCRKDYVGDGFYCKRSGLTFRVMEDKHEISADEGAKIELQWIVMYGGEGHCTLKLTMLNRAQVLASGHITHFSTNGQIKQLYCNDFGSNNYVCTLEITRVQESDQGVYELAVESLMNEGELKAQIIVRLSGKEKRLDIFLFTTIALGALVFLLILVLLSCKLWCNKQRKPTAEKKLGKKTNELKTFDNVITDGSYYKGLNRNSLFINNYAELGNNYLQPVIYSKYENYDQKSNYEAMKCMSDVEK